MQLQAPVHFHAQAPVSAMPDHDSQVLRKSVTRWIGRNCGWIAGILIAGAYGRIISDTVLLWLHDENYTHGLLIVPVIGFLLWRRRSDLARAAAFDRPTQIGAALMLLGLIAMFASQLLQIPFAGYWSLPVTITGVVLALYGGRVWRIIRFPIAYMLVAAPIPDFVFGPVSGFVQRLSSLGAASLMHEVGYTLALHGNMIELPGMTLEVADVCSGFKKMIALVAFALLYGYLTGTTAGKRIALVAAAVPIAIAANILRIGGLIAVASAGGDAAVKIAHDYAELAAIVVACLLFTLLGKALGCQQSSASA